MRRARLARTASTRLGLEADCAAWCRITRIPRPPADLVRVAGGGTAFIQLLLHTGDKFSAHILNLSVGGEGGSGEDDEANFGAGIARVLFLPVDSAVEDSFWLATGAGFILGLLMLVGSTAFPNIVEWQAEKGGSSMTLGQVYLAWSLMVVHGTRRLCECLFINRTSSAQMLLPHFAV